MERSLSYRAVTGMPVTDARMHRTGGVLRRRGAGKNGGSVNHQDASLAQTLTCVGLGERCGDGEPRKNGESVGWKVHAVTGP